MGVSGCWKKAWMALAEASPTTPVSSCRETQSMRHTQPDTELTVHLPQPMQLKCTANLQKIYIHVQGKQQSQRVSVQWRP